MAEERVELGEGDVDAVAVGEGEESDAEGGDFIGEDLLAVGR